MRAKLTDAVEGVDGQILDVLMDNARASVSEISRKLDIPRSTVAERIKKMEADGLIKGYSLQVDHARVGQAATVFVFVRIRPDPAVRNQNITMGRALSRMKGIEEVHLVSGEWDIILKARGPSLDRIFDTTMEELRRQPGVDRTQTVSCFTTVLEPN